MYNLLSFTNEKYKLLRFLFDNQVMVKKEKYIILSQEKIADMMHISKTKTNKLINELKKDLFINNYFDSENRKIKRKIYNY